MVCRREMNSNPPEDGKFGLSLVIGCEIGVGSIFAVGRGVGFLVGFINGAEDGVRVGCTGANDEGIALGFNDRREVGE
jgi:hypothetical protein